MFDLRAIRQTPEEFDANWARRGLSPQTPEILALDETKRALQTELQELLAERNEKSKEIGKIKSQGGDAEAIMAEVASLKDKIASLEEKQKEAEEALKTKLSGIPNQLAEDVPDGPDEDHNVEVRRHGEPKALNSEPKDHVDIGEGLDMMDFATAAKMSGSRFVLLHSGLARMERALAQFFLDTHTSEHGLTEVSAPLLVNTKTMFGTGQLPKFRDDQFKTFSTDYLVDKELLEESGLSKGLMTYNRDLWLIPTSEVSLTNIVAEEIIDEETLPRRYTAFTPCFRKEAGSAGKDTRGMIRMHQFYKVEMVSVTAPDKSEEEHERMTGCAENLLKKLELPFRTIVLCSGDSGFTVRKTYDLEVWIPSQETYREISSCSNCWDFQARRMNARCRAKGEKDTKFVHTLNGSGLAVGRALVAVMENYYDPADGGVFVPDVLKPYMGGMEKITPKG